MATCLGAAGIGYPVEHNGNKIIPLEGESPLLYDLESDPKLKKNIAEEYPHICQQMKNMAIADAGGEIPEFLRKLKGEPGCTPLLIH